MKPFTLKGIDIRKVTENDILGFQEGSDLMSDDIKVVNYRVNYGYGKCDPVSNVSFYDEFGRNPEKYHLEDRSSVSVFLPERYEELAVRLYIRGRDTDKLAKAKIVLKRFREELSLRPSASTPMAPTKTLSRRCGKMPRLSYG